MRSLAIAGSILLACLLGFAPAAHARSHHHHSHRHHPHHRLHAHVRTISRGARTTASRRSLAQVVVAAARRHGVPATLALGVASVESSFNPRARSRSGAVGLMQILPSTARGLGCRGSLANAAVNADCGARYLAAILGDHRGNVRIAAAFYNQGRFAHRVSRGGARYAALVLRHARRSPA